MSVVDSNFPNWSLIRRQFIIPVRLNAILCLFPWSNLPGCNEPKMKNEEDSKSKVLLFPAAVQSMMMLQAINNAVTSTSSKCQFD